MKSKKDSDSFFWLSVICILCIIFTPLLLKIPIIRRIGSIYLEDLHGMKEAYISIIGGIIGTFLAVSGALWTQRKIDTNNELASIKDCARLVVFDLSRFLLFTRNFYISTQFALNKTLWKPKIRIEWELQVLKLRAYLNNEDMEEVSTLYEDFFELGGYISKYLEDKDNMCMNSVALLDMLEKGEICSYNKEIADMIDKIANNILASELKASIKSDRDKLIAQCEIYNMILAECASFEKENNIMFGVVKCGSQEIANQYKELKDRKNDEYNKLREMEKDIQTRWREYEKDRLDYNRYVNQKVCSIMDKLEQVIKN